MTGFFGPLPISLVLSFGMDVEMKSSQKTEQSCSYIDMFVYRHFFGGTLVVENRSIFFFILLHEWSEMRRLASRVT